MACTASPRDHQVGLGKPVPGARRLEFVVGGDLEGQVEALVEFVLPLLGQAPGAHDETARQVAARDELFHEQSGHDCLAGAGVVGQQKAQRLARQHRFVDRGDLVREGLDERCVNGQQRVEEMGQSNAVRLRDQTEQSAVAVEAPRPAVLDDRETWFVFAIEQDAGTGALGCLVIQRDDIGAIPLDAHDRREAVAYDAADGSVGQKVFEANH